MRVVIASGAGFVQLCLLVVNLLVVSRFSVVIVSVLLHYIVSFANGEEVQAVRLR